MILGNESMICLCIFQSLKPFFYLSQLQSASVAIDKPHNTCSINWSKFTLTDGSENALQFTMFLQQQQYNRKGYSDSSHEDTIGEINKGISPELKQLAAEVLELFLPIPVKQKPSKRYDGSSIYNNPKFFPPRDAKA